MRFCRTAVLCLGVAALASASTVDFDDQDTSGGNVVLENQFLGSGVVFQVPVANGSDGCTGGNGCGFVAKNNPSGSAVLNTSTGGFDNFLAITGNAGVALTIDFTVPVHEVSFETLGLSPTTNAFLDGASIKFLDASNATLGTQTVNPIGPTATTISPTLVSFSSGTEIHAIQISKVLNGMGDGMFGFDDLTFSAPEPGSLFLLGAGVLVLGIARRRIGSRV